MVCGVVCGGPSRNLSQVTGERVNHQLFEKPREYEKQSNGEGILRVTGRGVRRGFDRTLPIASRHKLCICDLQSRYRV